MKTQQQAEREEQQRIKNLVLNYDLRDGDEQDGDTSFAPLAPNFNIHTYNAGIEKTAPANYKPDKSSNNRSGQRARKLQLSDVDWYGPKKKSHSLATVQHLKNMDTSEKENIPKAKPSPHPKVNSGRGFGVTPPRQASQSNRNKLPRVTTRGRLTRREIVEEHASRKAVQRDEIEP